MKKLSLLILILLLTSPWISFAEDANDEVFQWQLNEFGQAKKNYSNEIQAQMNNNPEGRKQEDLYVWQQDEYPKTADIYADEIQSNLNGFQEFPKEMPQEEVLTWQRRTYPGTKNIYDYTFQDAELQTEKLKEIRASRTQE